MINKQHKEIGVTEVGHMMTFRLAMDVLEQGAGATHCLPDRIQSLMGLLRIG